MINDKEIKIQVSNNNKTHLSMKTGLLIIAAAASMALASCSNDEPVATETGRAIDFRPALGARSRATETTNANLTAINVTAFIGDGVLFKQTEFTKGSDGYFVSSPEYYWPGDDSEVDFYAYSPSAPGGQFTFTSASKTLSDFAPAATMDQQVDFITSVASGKKSANEAAGVELTFNHQLSQIEVRAKTDTTAYTDKISGVRIGKPVASGSYDFNTNAWTLGSDKAIYTEEYDTPRTLTSTLATMMGDEGNAMLLPQQLTAWAPTTDGANSAQGAYLSVKLEIESAETGVQVYPFPSNANCQWASIPIDDNWEAGKKYIYNLDFTHGAGYVDPNDPIPGTPVLGGPIKFTVNVVDWDDVTKDEPMTTVE